MNRTTLAAAALAAFVFGCGSPSVGGSCKTGSVACEGSAKALECRAGKYVGLPCAGPKGCTQASGDVFCDYSGNRPGDFCALSLDGTGVCSADGTATLECRTGTVEKTHVCQSCQTQAGLIVCS